MYFSLLIFAGDNQFWCVEQGVKTEDCEVNDEDV